MHNLKNDEPIRVAQVVGKMNNGGVEAVVMNYYRNIDRSKVQFDFIIDSDSQAPFEREIGELGGRVYRVSPYQNLPKYIFDVYRIIRKNKYTIVHSHINTLNVFPLFAAFLAGTKVRISHSHSTAAKGEGKKTMMKYVLRLFSRISPTHYCACSEYAGRWLFGSSFYDSHKVKLIKNAIQTRHFSFNEVTRNHIREELGLVNKFVVGHVGRFVYQKNHDYLIDIFSEVHKQNPNAVLMLVGDGELEPTIRQKVTQLGLTEATLFMGPRQDVPDLMQAMDVFVLPSFYEGLPVVGVEAQTAGLPCILSDAMTQETKIIGSTKFISLYRTPEEWTQEVLFYANNYQRTKADEDIKKAGFEIQIASKDFEGFYCNLYNKLRNK